MNTSNFIFRGLCRNGNCNIGSNWEKCCSHFQQNNDVASDALCEYCNHRVTEHSLIIEDVSKHSVFAACMIESCRMSEDPCLAYTEVGGERFGTCESNLLASIW